MKKLVLGFSLSLAALAFLVSPVLAATSPDPAAPVLSAEDQEFLASLALPAGAPAPELEAKGPAIRPKSFCSATANCWNGGTVTCTSTVSGGTGCTPTDGNCNVGERGHVVCNGVTTSCPTACPVNCTALQQQCADNCGSCPIQTFVCTPYTCLCNRRSGFCT
jgi:hypothetical protein